MKRKYLLVLILLLIITGCGKKKENNEEVTTEIKYEKTKLNIVTSLEDELKENTIWCGTFNLAWNILKEEYVGGDVIVNQQNTQIDNLNKSSFTKKYLNENSYYTNYGKQTPSLKKKIEEDIKKKFNQTSDILDSFEWKDDTDKDFMYSMLYKNFKFENKFKKVKNTTFNNEGDYEYFGINGENNSKNQLRVLFYDDNSTNAIKILTKDNDEVILVKGINEKNFYEVYNKVLNKENNYNGNKRFNSDDTLLVPIIKFSSFEEFTNLENLDFKYKNGETRYIAKAIQTIKLNLTEEGGEIKSEAGISTDKSAAIIDQKEIRSFNYDSSFILFLKEKDSDLPYFAAYISDLKEFQK